MHLLILRSQFLEKYGGHLYTGVWYILVSVSVYVILTCWEKNSNEPPEDRLDRCQSASEVKSDQLRKKCALIVD